MAYVSGTACGILIRLWNRSVKASVYVRRREKSFFWTDCFGSIDFTGQCHPFLEMHVLS